MQWIYAQLKQQYFFFLNSKENINFFCQNQGKTVSINSYKLCSKRANIPDSFLACLFHKECYKNNYIGYIYEKFLYQLH